MINDSAGNHPELKGWGETHQRSLLVIAHPGHELRLHGWLASCRPDVVILTDGSGRERIARTPASRRLIDSLGAMPGPLFGTYTDCEIYNAFLSHDHSFFKSIATAIAVILKSQAYDTVVADPYEGYTPCHDLCRVVTDAACRRVSKQRSRVIASYDYELVRRNPGALTDDDTEIVLGPSELERKLDAAREYGELASEVTLALQIEGASRQGVERLRYIPKTEVRRDASGEPPFYERYGELQRASGHYTRVIRYQEHFVPVADALMMWADGGDDLE